LFANRDNVNDLAGSRLFAFELPLGHGKGYDDESKKRRLISSARTKTPLRRGFLLVSNGTGLHHSANN
jgi:hypothetical protein